MMWRSSIKAIRELRKRPWGDRLLSTKGDTIPVEKADCVVIGAGVVGLAIARSLAMSGRDVLVLDSAQTIGTATSSRNSEVIHAGIYYPTNSLKARLCVKGRKMMYDYCKQNSIPHEQIGKLILATSPLQIPNLQRLQSVGLQNGVTDLSMMEPEMVKRIEPEIECVMALWSPSTGIVDSHSFMLALQAEAERHNATFAFNSTVVGGKINEDGIHLNICETRDLHKLIENYHCKPELILTCKTVINSAGLSATSIVERLDGFPSDAIPKYFYARGCYFTLSKAGKSPFNHLIYPVPEDGGLGIHVTLDISHQVRFGPDVEWLDNIDGNKSSLNMFDYTVDANRAKTFYPEIRKYYPKLEEGALIPAYSGIRPKLSGRGQPAVDFVIQGQETHGIPGLLNLFGIESPGLTASMAIGEMVSLIASNSAG